MARPFSTSNPTTFRIGIQSLADILVSTKQKGGWGGGADDVAGEHKDDLVSNDEDDLRTIICITY